MASSMTSHVAESPPLVTTTTSVPFVSALQSSVPIPFVSTPELVATENLDLPPLIPAASHMIVSSHTTQQRPASLSVPAARSLYSTPSVNHFAVQEHFQPHQHQWEAITLPNSLPLAIYQNSPCPFSLVTPHMEDILGLILCSYPCQC